MRIDGSFDLLNNTGVSDIMSRLNIGDIVRAKVMEIAGNELVLKLFDGTTVNASMMSSIDVKQGEIVEFILKNKSDNQLFMETLKNNGQRIPGLEDEIKSKLLELGLKPDKRNIEVARELKNNNISLGRGTIKTIMDALVKFKDLTCDRAAFLVSKGISPEEKSIQSLNQLAYGTKVEACLTELMDHLIGIDDKKLLSFLAKGLESIDIKYDSINPDSRDVISETINVKPESLDANLEKQPLEKQISSYLKAFENELEGLSIDKKLISQIKQKTFEFLGNNNKGNIEPGKLMEHLKSNAPGFNALYNSNPKEVKNALNNLLKKLCPKDEKVDKGAFVENKSSKKYDSDADTLRRSFEKMFVRISEDTRDMDVNKVYKSMYEKLETLSKALEASNLPGKEDILMRIDSLKNNIEFVNDINRHSVYMQIPINVMDNNATGELYILKRDSKRKRIDPGNVTVFLSLDTKSLGQVESLISINRKSISLNMRFENREVIDLFKERFQELYNSLQEMGYKLADVKYRVIDEKVNLINVNKVLDSELNMFKKTFDFRI